MRQPGHRKKTVHIVLIAVAVFLAALIVCGLLTSKYMLSVSRYTIEREELTEPIRIVQLTDLHNSRFGADNSRLTSLVAEQKPDLILLTGDLLNQDEENTSVAAGLITGLTDVAPVYVSYGNHERKHEQQYHTDLRTLYTEAGATVLEYDRVDIEVNSNRLRLGGLYGYCLPKRYMASGEAWAEETEYLIDFQDTDRMTILMCHMPVCWMINNSLNEWDVDLVFAGHAHGGQVRIPWVGGLWAPDQGWFPGEESGLYWSEDGRKVMVLSRGLGTNEKIPRFNNIPEVTVVDLVPSTTRG